MVVVGFALFLLSPSILTLRARALVSACERCIRLIGPIFLVVDCGLVSSLLVLYWTPMGILCTLCRAFLRVIIVYVRETERDLIARVVDGQRRVRIVFWSSCELLLRNGFWSF